MRPIKGEAGDRRGDDGTGQGADQVLRTDRRSSTAFNPKPQATTRRRQQLAVFVIREEAITREFMRRRGNAAALIAAIVPPRTIAAGRGR